MSLQRLCRAPGRLVCFALALILFALPAAFAHETLPASLILEERSADVFALSWRVPATEGSAPDMVPVLPDNCRQIESAQVMATAGARIERWQIACAGGIAGKRVSIAGQADYLLDTVVRISFLDGRSLSRIARPRAPEVVLDLAAQTDKDERGFFRLGITHILGGIDHLLFIVCLILWVRSPLALLGTVTGFTLAHSITLALATLGVITIPAPPVEACIALSIVFLAAELLRARQPHAAPVSRRRPWLMAFAFGLLHGLGFAGALRDIGLPADGIASALLLFNLGVEAGQLLFVGMVLGMFALMRRFVLPALPSLQLHAARFQALPAYGVGTLAAFWFFQRLALVLETHVV
jgi:hypothetical protein